MSVVRALVVDDDQNDYILIRRMLSQIEGVTFKTDWAKTCDEGLEAIVCKQHDVYLVDYLLNQHSGKRNGLEFLKEAVSNGCKAPIIFMTGSSDHRLDIEAMKAGASDFLSKSELHSVHLERSIRYSIQHARMLQVLRDREEQFRLLFEKSLDGILIGNEDGRCLQINRAACDILGYERERALQKNISDFFVAEPPSASDRFKQYLKVGQATGEFSFLRSNGENRIAEFSACRLASNLHLGIIRDITENKLLEKQVLEISENEQRRIGQDLHDGLCQHLTGIACMSKVLKQKLSAKSISEANDASQIATLVDEAISQARDLARGLYPVTVETNDFSSALKELARNVERFCDVKCQIESEQNIQVSDHAAAIHLYRICQESINNAIKHGKARRITIGLETANEIITLTVKDNGVGLPKDVSSQNGMGLRAMNYRAGMIGASLNIKRGDSGGTVVACSFRNNKSVHLKMKSL
jgi:PAS domain S-box-containing protein